LIDTAHEEHEKRLRRDSQEVLEDKPELPEQSNTLKYKIPLIRDLAATMSESDLSEVYSPDETISEDMLEPYAIYYLNSDNFGFSGENNCRAVVELSEESVPTIV